jgi:hypothetical protein
MAVFWVVAPCILVKFTDVSDVFDSIIREIIEAANASETLVNLYQATRAMTHRTAIFILAAVRT